MWIQSAQIGADGGHAAGRKLLRDMYEARFNAPVPEILITDRGKPYFSGNPVFFSISHTKKHVFCVFSDQEVGIDAEETDRDVGLRLAEKILSPTEMAQFRKAADPRDALLRFWVLKEAAAKCTGSGLTGYPNQTAFSLDDDRLSVIDGCYVAVITG